VRYAWIHTQRDSYPLGLLCRVLQVSRSGYYAWRRREPSARAQRRQEIARAAQRSHRDSHGTYGYRRLADITYIRLVEGWLYLAVILDCFSRRIVGWSLSRTIDAALVCAALETALCRRCPEGDLVHHSDRGVQYASR